MADVKYSSVPHVTGDPWLGIDYFCTQRTGGYSTGTRASLNLGTHVGDNPDLVAANRALLQKVLPGQPVWLEQVHGTGVLDADSIDNCYRKEPPRADAAVTTTVNRVLAILTADCLPVLIADHDGKGLALAHAGWRGLANGILDNTFQLLQSRVPEARGWRAWIGPGIGQDHFEVGADVLEAFVSADPGCAAHFIRSPVKGRWQADLAGLAVRRLQQVGVEHIENSGWCTYRHTERFYSYRRYPVCGRMATLAWRKASE